MSGHRPFSDLVEETKRLRTVPTVQVREPCPTCKGSGADPPKREGHLISGTSAPCPACDGHGTRTRWVDMAELRRLLDEAD